MQRCFRDEIKHFRFRHGLSDQATQTIRDGVTEYIKADKQLGKMVADLLLPFADAEDMTPEQEVAELL